MSHRQFEEEYGDKFKPAFQMGKPLEFDAFGTGFEGLGQPLYKP